MSAFRSSPAPYERAHDAVVRHDDERVRPTCVDRARERGVEAREQLRVVLTAGRRGELAPAPRLAHAGPALVDLGARAALPLAAVPFAEARVGRRRALEVRRDDLGGARGPTEVGGVDDARARSRRGPAPGPRRGLGLARGGERRRRASPASGLRRSMSDSPWRMIKTSLHGWAVNRNDQRSAGFDPLDRPGTKLDRSV